MAILIKAGVIGAVLITPANGRAFTLAELQALVGGFIEVVRTRLTDHGEQLLIVLNEDGKVLQLPHNVVATAVFHEAGGHPDDMVVGDVLLATLAEMDEPEEEET